MSVAIFALLSPQINTYYIHTGTNAVRNMQSIYIPNTVTSIHASSQSVTRARILPNDGCWLHLRLLHERAHKHPSQFQSHNRVSFVATLKPSAGLCTRTHSRPIYDNLRIKKKKKTYFVLQHATKHHKYCYRGHTYFRNTVVHCAKKKIIVVSYDRLRPHRTEQRPLESYGSQEDGTCAISQCCVNKTA